MLCSGSSCSPPFPVLVCGGGVCVGVRVAAAPRLSLGRCFLGCACSRACAPLAPALPGGPAVARVCAGVAVGGVCPPPPPLYFFLFFWALWCRSLVVPVLGLVVSVPPFLLFRVALFAVCVFFVSACFGCPFSQWAAALGLVLRVVAGWSPGSPLEGPVFGAAWVGGLAATCGVGGRRGGCGPFSRPAPSLLLFLFGGGCACSSSAFPGLAHALVGILSGIPVCCWWLRFARPCPGPMGRVGYVHVGLGALSRRVRFWLCRVGGCARQLPVALG